MNSAEYCPLCHQPNNCQLCTVAAYKGPCWCAKVEIPDALLAKVPPDPWGRLYAYSTPGKQGEFEIISLGADGTPGGEEKNADLNNWELEKN